MSFDGERSPKRQRLESYSPASPPLIAETKHFVPPHTPPPSVRMSPSWQSQSNGGQSQQMTSGGGVFSTPPGAVGALGQKVGRQAGSEGNLESGRGTPFSEYGNMMQRDGEGDVEMKDGQTESERDGSRVDAEHRRTDHERQAGHLGRRNGTNAAMGSQPLSKLSTAPIAPSRPHPSQNFIELYGLQRIQASVARRDPITGEKINKLRKSYENKVKALGLEGRNKAQANQKELEGLLDPLWSSDVGDGKGTTMWNARYLPGGDREHRKLDDPSAQENIFSKLDSALAMAPGRLPPKEHKEWQNMLGLDDATLSGVRTPAVGPTKPISAAANAMSKAGVHALTRNSAPASPNNTALRPERSNKKRSYDDQSFEGYSGYEDDGYSTGGLDERGGSVKRQKRKNFQSAQNSPGYSNGPSSAMVGVRSS